MIKNLKIIASVIKPEQIDRLEAGANLHKRYSNIAFKVLEYGYGKISIETKQGKHLSKNYADASTLTERTKQLFKQSLPANIEINVVPIPYTEHHISTIDAGWLDQQMTEYHIRLKDIVSDTGIEDSNISAWRNGKRPMSQIVKTMFYYYFLNRGDATTHRKAS